MVKLTTKEADMQTTEKQRKGQSGQCVPAVFQSFRFSFFHIYLFFFSTHQKCKSSCCNLTPASKGFLTCTQTNTAWHGFYSSHKKAAFLEDVNLPQSLLICLAFSIPVGDSSPWQTNKPLLGLWWCQTAWGKQFFVKAKRRTMMLNRFPEISRHREDLTGSCTELPVENPTDSVSL